MVSAWRRKRPGLVVLALCLGGALTACGSGTDDEGYAAVGAGSSPKGAVPPSGTVTLVPLDPGSPSGTSGTSPGTSAAAPGTTTAPPPRTRTPGGSGTGTSGTSGTGGTNGTGGTTGTPSTTAPAATPKPTPPVNPPGTTPPPSTTPPGTTPPPAPAALTLSAPTLADTDRRWCESVTVTIRNTGGTATRSGTVAFATHIIGALGVDWATVRSSQPLPAPIGPGAARTQTYTVCVESWRVPLGMRVDTRSVTASWR
ncbi:hypothetical protein [Streptomyces sp. NPDC048659]|uniref:hypothetical protein n=1 Tax=Streptomyces sp. NPDC048659 TaxID=3155489 RepID=UPI00341E92C9